MIECPSLELSHAVSEPSLQEELRPSVLAAESSFEQPFGQGITAPWRFLQFVGSSDSVMTVSASSFDITAFCVVPPSVSSAINTKE